ncbi:MAG: DUF3987 domain-containing protein [Candidatus Melainabacteria bacterium]|jgi:hypothetical protein
MLTDKEQKKNQLIKHLIALGFSSSDDEIYFQIYTRDPDAKPKAQSIKLSFDDIETGKGFNELERLNNQGYSVAIRVNKGGSKEDEIKIFTAFFFESDELSLEEQRKVIDALPLKPSFEVYTKKSIHAYYVLDEPITNKLLWQSTQEAILSTKSLKADQSLSQANRAMRASGLFYCLKEKLGRTDLLITNNIQDLSSPNKYSLEVIQEAFPKEEKQKPLIKKLRKEEIKRDEYAFRRLVGNIPDKSNTEFSPNTLDGDSWKFYKNNKSGIYYLNRMSEKGNHHLDIIEYCKEAFKLSDKEAVNYLVEQYPQHAEIDETKRTLIVKELESTKQSEYLLLSNSSEYLKVLEPIKDTFHIFEVKEYGESIDQSIDLIRYKKIYIVFAPDSKSNFQAVRLAKTLYRESVRNNLKTEIKYSNNSTHKLFNDKKDFNILLYGLEDLSISTQQIFSLQELGGSVGELLHSGETEYNFIRDALLSNLFFTMSILLGKKGGLVKSKNGLFNTVQPNFQGVLIAHSGDGKSYCFNTLFKPFLNIKDHETNQSLSDEQKEYWDLVEKKTFEIAEQKKQQRINEIKIHKKGQLTDDEIETACKKVKIYLTNEQLRAFAIKALEKENIYEPYKDFYFLEDPTPELLKQALGKNPHLVPCIGWILDEFENILTVGRYSQSNQWGTLKSLMSGDNPMPNLIKNTGETTMWKHKVRLPIMGNMTLYTLRNKFKEFSGNTEQNRRFQYFVVRGYQREALVPDNSSLVQKIQNWLSQFEYSIREEYFLTDEAEAEFANYKRAVTLKHNYLRLSESENTAYLSSEANNILSHALYFQLCENSNSENIDLESLQKAIELNKVLYANYKELFSESLDENRYAEKVLRYVDKHACKELTLSKIYNTILKLGRKLPDKAEQINLSIEICAEIESMRKGTFDYEKNKIIFF